jgi:hypothetical protein
MHAPVSVRMAECSTCGHQCTGDLPPAAESFTPVPGCLRARRSQTGLSVDDGAVFFMDPRLAPNISAPIIAQLTVPSNSSWYASANIQGKAPDECVPTPPSGTELFIYLSRHIPSICMHLTCCLYLGCTRRRETLPRLQNRSSNLVQSARQRPHKRMHRSALQLVWRPAQDASESDPGRRLCELRGGQAARGGGS